MNSKHRTVTLPPVSFSDSVLNGHAKFWKIRRNLPIDLNIIRCLYSFDFHRKGERTEKKWQIRGWEVDDCTDDGKIVS